MLRSVDTDGRRDRARVVGEESGPSQKSRATGGQIGVVDGSREAGRRCGGEKVVLPRPFPPNSSRHGGERKLPTGPTFSRVPSF